jgi:hypothetical protein
MASTAANVELKKEIKNGIKKIQTNDRRYPLENRECLR